MNLSGDVPRSVVIALLLAAVLFLLLADPTPLNTYWSNLATDSITLLGTILIVDSLLARHERAKWRGADHQIFLYVLRFVRRGLNQLRVSLGVRFSTRTFTNKEDYESVVKVEEAFYAIFEEEVKDKLPELLDMASAKALARLVTTLRELHDEFDRTVGLFGYRLTPEQSATLVRIGNHTMLMLYPLEAIPELTDLEAELDGRRETAWSSAAGEYVSSGMVELSNDLLKLGRATLNLIPKAG